MRRLSNSGFRVWSREDLQGALRALDQANCDLASTIDSYEMQLYRKGYTAALGALAEMFAISYAPKVCTSSLSAFHSIEARVSSCEP